ncbi:uncharacterized protein LOC111389495 isoform X2 [Olea europaea var. sylvestris]|uniref:Uncharacterized protein n=2 Tax=Olea europaea subsp. europaea TaxID=158383 RepID=A0A8S0PZU0_OLEEU|nr:uncharacterized protein LOC111389495 isoform X2 [Olea europaea var. sylvestris]CAA2960130.1 Hypothetical predicted protein [Olea europaea subsp. europaea]
MRSWLLLILMLHGAESLRLTKESVSARNNNDIPESVPERRINGGVGEVFHCKIRHCSGRNGKLITKAVTHISSSDTIFKSEKTEGNKDHTKSKSDKISVTEENLPTNSSTVTDEKQQPVPEPYPDILDIAGMDYSQARRKPPIHN